MPDAPLPPMAEGEGSLPTPSAVPEGLSFQSRITKVTTAARPKSMLFLGKYKAGKTTLAASSYDIPALRAAGKQVLILEAEGGTASIAEAFPDVDQLEVPNFHAFQSVRRELLTVPHNYGVVIVDTLDKFQEMARDHYLAVNSANTQKGWGEVAEWTTSLAWDFHHAGFMAIFLVHQTEDKNERTGAWQTELALQGSAKNKLGQVFDIIGHLTVRTDPQTGDSVRTLRVGPQEGNVTGNRYESKLPSQIDNPTLPAIFEMIEAPNNNAASTNEGTK